MTGASIRLCVSVAFLLSSLAYLRANWPTSDRPADWDGERYTVQKTVYLGNQHVFSLIALNDKGQIVGTGPGATRKFCAQFFDGRVAHDLGSLPGHDGSRAYGLNNLGVVAGSSYVSKGSYSLRPTHACYWDRSGIHPLPTLPGYPCSRAWSVDDRGVFVGHSYKPESELRNASSQPTLWIEGKAVSLPLPSGAQQGEARSNAGGTVVGTVLMRDGTLRGCTWIGGRATLLNPLPGCRASEAIGIAANGRVVGLSDTTVTIWDRGIPSKPFEPPGAVHLRPVGLDDSGTIAFNALGTVVNSESENATIPFLYRPGRGSIRVSHLIPAHVGFDFVKVLAINAKGQIAVGARYKGESACIYLLSPPGVADAQP